MEELDQGSFHALIEGPEDKNVPPPRNQTQAPNKKASDLQAVYQRAS